MIPEVDCEIEQTLPDHELWLPSAEELDGDEGFGPFRDTWVITGVEREEAEELLAAEMAAIACVDRLVDSAEDFDALLDAIECGDTSSLDAAQIKLITGSQEFESLLEPEGQSCAGLDLGVAGLVYSLALLGCYPAASCRGHPEQHAWSAFPLVRFAAPLEVARRILEPASRAGCGLIYENPLLTLWAPSVTCTIALARNLNEEIHW